ncbi:VWA domain-containing protein [Amphritea pacifica]|uniref:VWA domain-containing protein n=1 Tax=Amphritea pacifica TaxID=2811233 RepID=A0ABS2W6V3_9GAMM|nr:VWA domain-containing protein [Amphritea pacifica]MBN0987445.1 VWA domain-containing protein [Amphritea pacifica]MBN1005993.1 VWA domain-containing protein [Amphritea pacifica]
MREKHPLTTVSSDRDIEEFLQQAQQLAVPAAGDARMIFSLDATASRERTWDHACHLQSEMFLQTRELGQLSIQLCHYGGMNQFSASPWLQDTNSLLNRMNSVKCLGGHTQIARLLEHCLKQTRQQPVQAIIFIGDCVEEPVDFLCQLAGQLGIHSTPLFIFQEGHDITAAHAFKQMSRLSGGAYCRFDDSSAATLKALLSAVAVYATGGRRALLEYAKKGHPDILQLTHQLK